MRPEEALALVGLEARMDHFPAQLSGGEQQRVAIARAIAKRPEVLLCDEPTGALDSKTGIRVIEALLTVNAQLGTTTLIITHNASIQDVADRVLFFADGQISRSAQERDAPRRRRAQSGDRMRALDIKLFRDLRRLWAQALAIALVIAGGVATLVLAVGSYRSLDETRTAYYERYRFADVFAVGEARAEDAGRPHRGNSGRGRGRRAHRQARAARHTRTFASRRPGNSFRCRT